MKPKVNSAGEAELVKVEGQLREFEGQVQKMTLDHMNQAPVKETESNVQLSKAEIQKQDDTYLKPNRAIGCKDRFNEDYRKEWEFAKEYVCFMAENNMIIGEQIEMWTKPFAGIPAEFWKVPVGKKVWGPRHLAEQIKRARHHKMVMTEATTGTEGGNQFYGQMAVSETVQRLDAKPVGNEKSIFMSR